MLFNCSNCFKKVKQTYVMSLFICQQRFLRGWQQLTQIIGKKGHFLLVFFQKFARKILFFLGVIHFDKSFT